MSLDPTDKNYKVYVHNEGGETFRQAYRDCPWDGVPEAERCKGPDTCAHWVTRETSQTKFYFQHLGAAQQQRFIDLLNGKKIRLNYPGHFYARPFFVMPAGTPTEKPE